MNWFGTLNVSVIVSDGFLIDSKIFEVIVLPVNDAPLSDDIAVTMNEDTQIIVPVNGSDIDSDTLYYELINPPNFGELGPLFSLPLNVTGEGFSQELFIGYSPFASDDYDEGIDQYAPPSPPPPSLDVAIGWNGDRYYSQIISGFKPITEYLPF